MEGLKNIQELLDGNQNTAQLNKLSQNPNQSYSQLHSDGFLIRKHLELKNGKVIRMSQAENQKNSIEYYRYHGLKGLLAFIIDALMNWENVLTLTYIIFHSIAQDHVELTMYYPIVALILNIVIRGIINFIIDLKMRRACQIINMKECQKFVINKKSKAFENKKWSTLLPGDIIKVEENQEFPADVLILDVMQSSNENKCYVRGGSLDDGSNPVNKKSCEGTQNKTPGINISASQFVDQISGLVKYEYNSVGFFSGSYKLNNNPAAFQLALENIAIRGSHLYQTKSVMCLVLNVGTECMGSIFKDINSTQDNKRLNSKVLSYFINNRKNFNEIYYRMSILIAILFGIIIGISILVTNWARFQQSASQHSFLDNILRNYQSTQLYSKEILATKDILGFISGLMVCLPFCFRVTMDSVVLINSYYAENYYNSAPSDLKFNQGYTMKALGKISNIFISKSGLFNHNIQKVKMVKIGQLYYKDSENNEDRTVTSANDTPNQKRDVRRESFQQKVGHQSAFNNYHYPFPNQNPKRQLDEISNASFYDQSNLGQRDNMDGEFQEDFYHPGLLNFNPAFVNYQLSIDVNSYRTREQIKELMRCLTLCHQATRRKEPSSYSKNLYKSIYQNEQAQLMFAHSYGYEFVNRKNKTITINCQGTKERYDVMVIDTFMYLGQRLSVIVIKPYQTQNSGGTLYIGGPLSSMFEFLNQSEKDKDKCIQDMKHFSQNGMIPYVYARKDLNNDECHDLKSKIDEALSLAKDQKEKIELSLMTLIYDLQPLGELGIQDIYKVRDVLTIQDFLRNGVKVWFLNQEDEALSIIKCNAMKLLQEDSHPLLINGITEKEVEDQIKSCLKIFTGGSYDNKSDEGKQKQEPRQSNSFNQFNIPSQKPCQSKNEPQKQLIVSGESLKYILREESILKRFLTISVFCDLIIGSLVTALQRVELMKHVKQYQTNGSYTMAIIGSSEDKNLILEADVSVALNIRYQQSDNLITSDIVMNDLYPLTYLVFQHGTVCLRRLNATTKIILYKTFFIGIVFLFYMCYHSFSASLPIKRFMFMIFMWIISNLQIFLYAIQYKDVGYDYFYRIVGEYKRNFSIYIFDRYDLMIQFSKAVIDSILFLLIFWQKDYVAIGNSGKLLSNDGYQLYHGILLYSIFSLQLTNQNEIAWEIMVAIAFINIFGIIFMLEDENLVGVTQYFSCPSVLLYTIFVVMACLLKNYIFDIMRKILIQSKRDSFNFYTDVEDRLYLEEYEDPNQEFSINMFQSDYEKLEKQLAQQRITTINQNLMKLQRSDSMDIIIEKLNENHSGLQQNKIQDSTILNWITLAFNDSNKEQEYNELRMKEKNDLFRRVLTIVLAFNFISIIKDIILSSVDKIEFETFYLYLGYSLMIIIALIANQRFQNHIQVINAGFMLIISILYSICYYYMDFIEFTMSLQILTLNFALFGTYIKFTIICAVGLYILIVNLINSYVKQIDAKYIKENDIRDRDKLIIFITIYWFIFVLTWSLHIYWKEKWRRLAYWYHNKKQKEFSKLKSILHILMPAFVRERIRQGQRYIADDQGDVTLIFCDISDFDNIVSMFSGRELCDFLDHIYNAFDQLCEQHGLQKIETVGKTYMACGGLKQTEKKFDQILLNKHHSVRATQFAFNIQRFLQTQTLKDGSPLKVKIGIHSGHVISGVVGENKPQFSLIGGTVNKTSRVCAGCQPGRILTSRETWNLLNNNTDQYFPDQISVFFKGIGQEDAFYVQKKPRGNNYPKLTKDRLNKPKKNERSRSLQANLRMNLLHQKMMSKQKASPIQVYNQNANAADTSRSLIQSDNQSQNNDPLELLNQLSDNENLGDGDSFIGENLNSNFGEKDDIWIQRNPVENTQYNLVERPNYLLQFSNNNPTQQQLEEYFRYSMIQHSQLKKYFFLFTFAIFNKIEFAIFGLQHKNEKWAQIVLYIYPPLLIIFEIILFLRIKFLKMNTVSSVQKMLIIYLVLILITNCYQCYRVLQETILIQIFIAQIMITFSFIYFFGTFQMNQALFIYISILIIWIIFICGSWSNLTVKSYSYVLEMIIYTSIYIYIFYHNEMLRRKLHNQGNIMDVELRKTNNLLNNLVPPPVLQGIKNDLKVVDELEDVTLLFTDMVKFTDFSKNVKNPKEVVKLLSELFTRFDQLCVANQVYKVHTIGDCYVIMGYTGHIPQSERTPKIKAQEAFKVIKTGFEMIEIIQDVRDHSDNPDLKELNMRIGIHTGKIVAGIIGTKIVRYDIFGADVLIANKMESNGLPGEVVVSEDTKNILLGMPELHDALDFNHHKVVNFESIKKKSVEAFLVTPKLSEEDQQFKDQNNQDEEDSLSEDSIDSQSSDLSKDLQEDNRLKQSIEETKNVQKHQQDQMVQPRSSRSNSIKLKLPNHQKQDSNSSQIKENDTQQESQSKNKTNKEQIKEQQEQEAFNPFKQFKSLENNNN